MYVSGNLGWLRWAVGGVSNEVSLDDQTLAPSVSFYNLQLTILRNQNILSILQRIVLVASIPITAEVGVPVLFPSPRMQPCVPLHSGKTILEAPLTDGHDGINTCLKPTNKFTTGTHGESYCGEWL